MSRVREGREVAMIWAMWGGLVWAHGPSHVYLLEDGTPVGEYTSGLKVEYDA